jgi:hypothetical protein
MSGMAKHAGRTHDAHELGTVEQRHFPVQHDDVGRGVADHFQRGDAVAGVEYLLHADIGEQVAHDVAHERIIGHHQHAELLDKPILR